MRKAQNKGFAPFVLIVVVAIAAAVGGGVYYSKHKTADDSKTEDRNGNDARGKGSIKALLSLGKESKCTVSGTLADGSAMTGTTYISGSKMKGDFSMTASNGTKIDSHMLRLQNDVYVWTGSQGAKMNISELESQNKAKTVPDKGSVDLNADVDYSCEDWDAVEAAFAVPASVNFVDVSSMMKNMPGQMDATLKANVNTNLKTSVNLDTKVKVGY